MKLLKKDLSVWFLSFLIFACAVFSFLSVFSYDPADNSIYHFDSLRSFNSNIFGYIGSSWAAILFEFMGLVAYLFIIGLFYFSYLVFNSELKKNIDRLISGLFFLSFLSTTFAFYNYHTAGFLGFYILAKQLVFFDKFIVALITSSMLLISFLIMARLSFVQFFEFVFSTLRFAYKVLAPFVKTVFFKIINLTRSFYSWVLACFDGRVLLDKENKDIEYKYAQKTEDFWSEYFSLQAKEGVKDIANGNSENEQISVLDVDISKKLEPCVKLDAVSKKYELPSLDIFTEVKNIKEEVLKDLKLQAKVLESKLEQFNVLGKVTSIKHGPVITLFEYQPEGDSKISKILSLEDDLAMVLEAKSIRIIAPIPGKSVVGFEIANKNASSVYFSNVIKSEEYKNFKGNLPLILGEDIIGKSVVVDLAKMPHLLVAGSTGSGKSVALNTMLVSLLCKHDPDELKLILIDPKRLEFASYQDIAHLVFPIVTQVKDVSAVLRYVVKLMEDRYEYMSHLGVKNIFDYHDLNGKEARTEMPFLVVVIDELADLMMTAGKDVELQISRIAQMARAAGIHMIVATQRPSVDVVTGLIKVNFPSRISFRVTSKVDSRTILDCVGAEKLLGRGDMLFMNSSSSELQRVHGAYVSSKEIFAVVDHIKNQKVVEYQKLNIVEDFEDSGDQDELLKDVLDFVNTVDEISISLLQRRFRIGYNRSARIIEKLEEIGYILPADGGKMRKVVKNM